MLPEVAVDIAIAGAAPQEGDRARVHARRLDLLRRVLPEKRTGFVLLRAPGSILWIHLWYEAVDSAAEDLLVRRRQFTAQVRFSYS